MTSSVTCPTSQSISKQLSPEGVNVICEDIGSFAMGIDIKMTINFFVLCTESESIKKSEGTGKQADVLGEMGRS